MCSVVGRWRAGGRARIFWLYMSIAVVKGPLETRSEDDLRLVPIPPAHA
jgi:hypothetical protein